MPVPGALYHLSFAKPVGMPSLTHVDDPRGAQRHTRPAPSAPRPRVTHLAHANMGKQRVSALDIRLLATELNTSCGGLRLTNIYDVAGKMFLLNSRDTSPLAERKVQVLVEPGRRIHSTKFDRDKPGFPSAFTLRLRKFIRNWRLERVTQVGSFSGMLNCFLAHVSLQHGFDRIMDFQFGVEDKSYHLVFEFYAKGNLLLTDSEYNIIATARTVKTAEVSGPRYAVGEAYPLHLAQKHQELTAEALADLLSTRPEGKKKHTVTQALASSGLYSKELAEHCVCASLGLGAKKLDASAVLADEAMQSKLLESLTKVDELAINAESAVGQHSPTPSFVYLASAPVPKPANLHAPPPVASTSAPTGAPDKPVAAVATTPANPAPTPSVPADQVTPNPAALPDPTTQTRQPQGASQYTEVSPLPLAQLADLESVQYPCLNEAMDVYFSEFDLLRHTSAQTKKDKTKLSRIDKVRLDHEKRISELRHAQVTNERVAKLIHANIEEIDNAIQVVLSAVGAGTAWGDIWAAILEQQKRGNPIANAIHSLQLDHSQITMLLSFPQDPHDEKQADTDSDDDEEEGDMYKTFPVVIDITQSAHANARRFYADKKQARAKEEKTAASTAKALASAETKADAVARKKEAAKQQQKQQQKGAGGVKLVRKNHWFERYHWFISSDRFLVVGGRDAGQNEHLVRRYLGPSDLYVHGDIHGATTVVVWNPQRLSVPLTTLAEAGQLAICHSSAWNNKVPIGAWWVYAHQVSKAAPSGEYLPTGSFMVRGRKNYLPPSKLELSVGVLFRAHDDQALASQEEDSMATQKRQEAHDEARKRFEKYQLLPLSGDSVAPNDAPLDSTIVQANPSTQSKVPTPLTAGATTGTSFLPATPPSNGPADTPADGDSRSKVDGQNGDDCGVGDSDSSSGLPTLGASKGSSKGTKPTRPVEEASEADASQQSLKASALGGAELSRGQRKKQKKIAKKYQDQSDSEREMNMRMQGAIQDSDEDSHGKKKKRGKGKGKGKGKPVSVSKVVPKPVHANPGGPTRAVPQTKRLQAVAPLAEREEVVQNMQTDLDSMMACPPDDYLLLYALPVCGPTSALSGYKFCCQVLPGTLKKGQVSKAVLHKLVMLPSATEQQLQLIKAVNTNTLIEVCPANAALAESSGPSSFRGIGKKK
eukprot:gene2970-581_t